jgi:hypothetical protein
MLVSRTHLFDAPIAECWTMFQDPDSHVAKFTAMGHRELSVVECDRDDDRLHLVIDRLVDVEVPSFARRVFQPTNQLRSVDEWARKDASTCAGTFVLSTKGVPLDISGTTLLTAEGDRSRYQIDVEVTVRVPVIGRRVAEVARGIVDQQLTDEFRLGDEWLVSH